MKMHKKTEANQIKRVKAEKDLSLDVWTFIFVVIGFIASWVNMIFILEAPSSVEVLAFLSIIFTTMIPGIIISLVNRYWGYAYLIGFASAGIPFLISVDLFIGGYTFATTLFIFIILWLIFWKAWRSLSSIKSSSVMDEDI
jgi:hypothetical protein